MMVPLASLHTFGLNTHCQSLANINDVESARDFVSQHKMEPFYFLGHGSNTLFIDDFEGHIALVKMLGKSVSETPEDYIIEIGAGENWHQFVCWTLEKKMFGLENLALIPGTVGAAPIQNIGAYGSEIKDFIHSVTFLDCDTGTIKVFDYEECQFAYRSSIFKTHFKEKALILSVTFTLPKQWHPNLNYGSLSQLKNVSAQSIFSNVVAIRQSKLPDINQIGNAGSFFKNPVISNKHYTYLSNRWPDIPAFNLSQDEIKIPAAWLIDQAGLKGFRIGDVQVHPKQALVLTNLGSATGEDLIKTAKYIMETIYQEYKIKLEVEVRLMGKHGAIEL